MSHHHKHQRPVESSSSPSGTVVGGGGTMFCNTSYHVGDIYDVPSSTTTTTGTTSCASASVSVVGGDFLSTKSMPFDSSSFWFNPLGEVTPSVNMRRGVPFTATQLQELERQTIIYKYLMSSVPVPPQLLMSINSNNNRGLLMELGISSCCGVANSDPEPWRCKRTDGKKWRCSRDVAPDQRYCERHSHKNRPRSRKHVELHTDSTAVTPTTTSFSTITCVPDQKSYFPDQSNRNLSIFPSATSYDQPNATSYDQRRSLDWFLKGETIPVASDSDLNWRQMRTENNTESNEQEYDLPQYHARGQQVHSNLYVNSLDGLNSLESSSKSIPSFEESLSLGICHPQAQETRHFLDDWSTAVGDNNNSRNRTSSSENLLPVSLLTLSMCSTNSEQNDSGHGSWMDGGPLGEALLCLGIPSSAKAAAAAAAASSSFGSPPHRSS